LKVSLAWLREFVAVELSAEQLAARLTMAGLEVESIERHGSYERMVAGRIVRLEPHPRADKLAICTVDTGAAQAVRLVSGAPNLREGLPVAIALPGATLADGSVVEPAEIRGVASEAVVLSEREIGISDDHSGVMALDDGAVPGVALAEVLGTADTILDVSVTPNRGDCLSVLGIAREVAAISGARLRAPRVRVTETPPPAADGIRVEIHDRDLCNRYVARIVRGVTIRRSPLWMRNRLESLGVRAINNVVDVTNYVMLERGQPLHAFDLARIRGGVIVVRRAGADRTMRTLDDIERGLETDDLVIADGEGAVALAGVMGGLESAVTDATTDVLLEAAHFAPLTVRRTSRRLGLRSEASLRFERSVDLEGVPHAADRAAALFARVARGKVAAGRVDQFPNPPPAIEIVVRSGRANRLLGTDLAVAEIGKILRRVSTSVKSAGRGSYVCRPPSYRVDLTREADFVEEIARLAGYDRIPATQPLARAMPEETATGGRRQRNVREALRGQGMVEMVSHRFVSNEWNARIGGLAPAESAGVRLLNPMASDEPELRRSLIPGLLAAAARNRRQGEAWIRAFELGNVFWSADSLHELTALGGLLAGPVPPRGLVREDRQESFYDAKGVLEALLAQWRVDGVTWSAAGVPDFLHPGKAAVLRRGTDALGYVGGLHPRLAAAADVAVDTWVYELDFKKVESYCSRRITFQPLPKYPAIVRDLAVVADDAFEAQAVLETIAQSSDLPVDSVRVFDLYRGAPLPSGKKSVAYSIAYRAADRTLTDEEVNRLHQRLIERVTRELGVELRG